MRHSIGDKVHLWDGANIVADVDGNDVVVYIRGINLIYADDGDITYYHFNTHGDVVVLTNASGTKTKSYLDTTPDSKGNRIHGIRENNPYRSIYWKSAQDVIYNRGMNLFYGFLEGD